MRITAWYALPLLFVLQASLTGSVCADQIHIAPTDSDAVNIARMERAGPGDEVIIAPGVYRFRLYLSGLGTEAKPIVIRAQDPANRPVWDLAGKATSDWPGTYAGGDRGRSIWQITGAHYQISSIVFRNGSDRSAGDGGGVRLKFASHTTFRDCLFQFNDNGLQGAGTQTLVEFSEFDRNGLPGSSEASHNLYMHGGDLTVRYSYIHDARAGQNLHIRANRAVFEYNWIARPTTYMADMMSCTMAPCNADQHLLLRGNVFIVGSPRNDRQIFALMNDQRTANIGFHLSMVNNTVVGSGSAAALVHLVNVDPSLNRAQSVLLINNALIHVSQVIWADRPTLANWSAKGTNNWVNKGTIGTAGLTRTVAGTSPRLRKLAAYDLVPVAPSALIGAAADTLRDRPVREYYRDETLSMRWRCRCAALDIGAFESTTSGPSVRFGEGASSACAKTQCRD